MAKRDKESRQGQGRTSGVDIKISAEDDASGVIAGVGEEVDELGKKFIDLQGITKTINEGFAAIASAADTIRKSLVKLGEISTAGFGELQKVAQAFLTAVQLVKEAVQQPVVSGLIESTYNAAIEATQEVQSLSDVLGAVGETAKGIGSPFAQGFFGLDLKKEQTVFKKTVESINNLFEKQIFGENALDRIFNKSGLGDRVAQSMFGGRLGVVMSNEIRQNFINSEFLMRVMPKALKERLINGTKSAFTSVDFARVAKAENMFVAIKDIFAERVASGVSTGFKVVDKFIDGFASRQGARVGAKLDPSQMFKSSGFERLDSKNPVTSFLDLTLGGPAQKHVSKLSGQLTDHIIQSFTSGLAQGSGKIKHQVWAAIVNPFVGIVEGQVLKRLLNKTLAAMMTDVISAVGRPIDALIGQNFSERMFANIAYLKDDKYIGKYIKKIDRDFLRIQNRIIKSVDQFLAVPTDKLGEQFNNLFTTVGNELGQLITNFEGRFSLGVKKIAEGGLDTALNLARGGLESLDSLIGQKSMGTGNFMEVLIDGLFDASLALADFKKNGGFDEIEDNFLGLATAGYRASSAMENIFAGTQFGGVFQASSGFLFDIVASMTTQGTESAANFVTSFVQSLGSKAQEIYKIGVAVWKFFSRGFSILSRVASIFMQLDDYLDGLLSDIGMRLGKRFVTSFTAAASAPVRQAFAPFLSGIANVVSQTEMHLLTLVDKIQKFPEKVSGVLDNIAMPIGAVTGVLEPVQLFQSLQGAMASVAEKANKVTESIFFFTSAFETVKGAVVNGPYQMLIGQNVQLRQQLLKTQASLVATNKILRDGSQITDPSEAILALNSSVNAVLSQVRKDSLELVGVTSSQLTEVFNIISTEASNAGINLQQAGKLVIDFSAALGTIGLPLEQAGQEIRSIFNAQVTSDSALAKQIGITNDQIKKLKQQGKLYDFLREKLKAFSAGNALAAQTIEGVGSNIQDLFELMGLYAGEQLLDPVVNELNNLYQFMNKNQAELIDYSKHIASEILRIFNAFVDMGKGVGASLGDFISQIPTYLFAELAAGAESLRDAVLATLAILQPFIGALTELFKMVRINLSGPLFKVFILLKTMSFAIKLLGNQFGIITNILVGVGEVLFYKEHRMGALINQYTVLVKQVGLGSGAMLMMGKHMGNLPFVAEMIANKFGILGKIITPFIPQISGLAIALIGLRKQGGMLGGIIEQIGGAINAGLLNDVLPQLAAFARSKNIPALADQFDEWGDKIGDAANRGGLFGILNETISDVMKDMGEQAKKAALGFGAMAIGLAAASIAVYEYLKRVKDAGDEIRDFAEQSRIAAYETMKIWVDTSRKVQENPMFDDTYVPPSDWIDGFIEKSRQWNQGTYEVKNNLDRLYLILIGIGNLGMFLVKVIQTVGRGFFDLGRMFVVVFKNMWNTLTSFVNLVISFGKVLAVVNPLDPSTWGQGKEIMQKAIDDFVGSFGDGMNRIGQVIQDSNEGFYETWAEGWSAVSTKSEEELAEIARAIKSGEMQEATQALILQTQKMMENSDLGDLFGDAIAPVEATIEALRSGTGSIEEVEAAIAALPDAFPESEREAMVRSLRDAFPTGMSEATAEAHRLAAALKAVEGEDTMILSDTIEQFRQGKATAGDVADALAIVGENIPQQEFDELDKALNGALNAGLIETYDSANELNKSLDSLDNTLSTSRANTANTAINMHRKRLESAIEDYDAIIKKQEENVRHGNADAIGITRSAMIEKAKLEAQLELFNTAAQSVDIIADPVRQLENYLSGINEELDRLNASLEATAKKGLADLTEAMAAGDISQGLVDVKQFESDTENMARRAEELRMRLQRAYNEYAALDESELSRAQEVGKTINELSQQYSDLRVQIAQKEKERKDQLKEAEMDSIEGQLAQGLLTEEEYNEATSKLKLERNQKDIEKARRSLEQLGDAEIEERKLIEAEIAKLFAERQDLIQEANEKELKTLDNQIDEVLDIEKEANLERQRQRIEAFNQAGGNIAEIERASLEDEISETRKQVEEERKRLQAMMEATPLSDPIAEAERQGAIRDQRIKTSEMTLDLLNKEKNAYDDLTELILTNREREQKATLADLQEQLNAGKGSAVEISTTQASQEVENLTTQLEREKDINKQAELRLHLLQAQKAEYDALTESIMAEQDIAQYAELAGVQARLNAGAALSGEMGIVEAKQRVDDLTIQLDRETDINKQAELRLQLLKAQRAELDAVKDYALQQLGIADTQQLTELTRQYNEAKIIQEEMSLATAEQSLKRLEAELDLETDKEKRVNLEKQIVESQGAVIQARKALILKELTLVNTKELTQLKKLLNLRKVMQEEFDARVAQQNVDRIETELKLETDRARKIELQMELIEAQGQLIEANINLYKAKLDKETLKYENAIRRQNQELEKQANAMDLVSRAIDQRNQLMSAQQSLYQATSDYFTGGLEAIAKMERSDRRRAKINELIAAVRLKTAVEQAKYEQKSLEIQQFQQRIALEREAIEKRIAANQAAVDEKRAKNALMVALKRGAPQEEIEALALEYQGAKEISALRGVDLKLIEEQRANLEEIQAMERESQEFRSRGAIRSAEAESIAAITSTGRRNRAMREFSEETISQMTGEDMSRSRFANRSQNQAEALRDRYGSLGTGTRRSEPVIQLPPGMTPQIEPNGLAEAFGRAMQIRNAAITETNISPTINFDVKVMGNADGAAIVRQAQPQLENVVDRMVTLSKR